MNSHGLSLFESTTSTRTRKTTARTSSEGAVLGIEKKGRSGLGDGYVGERVQGYG